MAAYGRERMLLKSEADEAVQVGGSRPRARSANSRVFAGAFEADSEALRAAQAGARLKGWAFLFGLAFCIACYGLGISLPLVEVRAFPKTAFATTVVKSTLGTILDLAHNHCFFAAIALAVCDVVVPLAKFVGTSIILWDNLFAAGYDYVEGLSEGTHIVIVSLMYVSCSFQMLDIFCVICSLCFFSCDGAVVTLCSGFYFFSAYCIASVILLQLLQPLVKVGGGSDTLEDDGRLRSRAYSELVPSLPAVKPITGVDTVHVLFFATLFLGLIGVGFLQPLLDVHIVIGGVTFQRRALSLGGMIWTLCQDFPLVIGLAFTLFVVAVPALYAVLMALAGIMHFQNKQDVTTDDPQEEFYRLIIKATEVLRPWAMTDVFSLALAVFIFSARGEHIVATIPSGLFAEDVSKTYNKNSAESFENGSTALWNQFFSGTFLVAGSGLAMCFLRWFWSSSSQKKQALSRDVSAATVSEKSCESDDSDDEEDECCTTCCEIFVGITTSKALRSLVIWILICLSMHAISPSLPTFGLRHVNDVLNDTVPVLNSMFPTELPATFGVCEPPGIVPPPCKDGPVLWQGTQMNGTRHVKVFWVSGLNTTSLSMLRISASRMSLPPVAASAGVGSLMTAPWNASVNSTALLPSDPLAAQGTSWLSGTSWSPTVAIQQVTLEVAGMLQKVSLFLNVRDCDKENTSSCHKVLNSGDACCDDQRHFRALISAECRKDGAGLSDLKLLNLDFDPLVVAARLMVSTPFGNATVDLPSQDISSKAEQAVRKLIEKYLTTSNLIWWGNGYLSMEQILTRVIRFNDPRQFCGHP